MEQGATKRDRITTEKGESAEPAVWIDLQMTAWYV